MELKDQIRLARQRKGLSQEDVRAAVAKELGKCSLQAVKYWELGSTQPRVDAMRVLEKLLDVRLSTTGDLSDNELGILKDLSPEAIDLAKAIESMPKDLRHAIVMVIGNLIWYKEGRRTAKPFIELEPIKASGAILTDTKTGKTHGSRSTEKRGRKTT